MNKILEYIKLIPAGLANIDKVAEGFINQVKMELGTLPPEEVEIIAGRRLICSQCPLNSANATKAGWYKSDRSDIHCTACGCPVKTRTASLEMGCGIETLNAKPENLNTPLPLKWDKVK